ncbi:MAG: hypothetical protein NVSMB29_11540 [Candidatus Dormibacteria bacterium]
MSLTYNRDVAVADAPAPRPAPPTPDECAHPAPVRGVMAHEFSHYDGAQGPEGTRRTTTYYGPVLGGLPINAWHCEECGLLRLDFPDGRMDERRLYPGPQPGLIAEASTESTDWEHFGLQARVSGVSAPRQLIERLEQEQAQAEARRSVRTITIPDYGLVGWATVGLLGAVAFLLLLAGTLAAASTSTPDAETPLVVTITALFVGWLALVVGTSAYRHWVPSYPLRASVAVSGRAEPQLDGVTKIAVALFVLTIVVLSIVGALAAFSTSTPDIESFLVALTVALFLGALLTLIAGPSLRRRRTQRE